MDVHPRLDELLATRGRMNFVIDCTYAGAPARLTMDEKQVYLAMSEDGGRLVADVFSHIDSSGTGVTRAVKLGTTTFELTFADAYDADRFGRVLGVRRAPVPTTRPRFSPAGAGGGIGSSHAVPGAMLVGDANLRTVYERNLGYTMTASIVLLALGWVDAVLGVIIALGLLLTGHPLVFVYALVIAVAGAALPLTIGFLARTVVHRFRLEDSRRPR